MLPLSSLLLLLVVLCTTTSAADVPELIDWVWMGGLTSTSVTFRVALLPNHPYDVSIVHDLYIKAVSATDPSEMKKNFQGSSHRNSLLEFNLVNLSPNHRYDYSIRVGSDIHRSGSFQTPADGPFDFVFAFGSCMDAKSDPRVFDAILAHQPLFFVHLGDLHYDNININLSGMFDNGYLKVLHSSAGEGLFARLNSQVPMAYMWDDHDYGTDNSDRFSPGRKAALNSYRKFVPHYPLDTSAANAQDDELRTGGSLHQSFTIGSVLFLLTDLRSQRSPNAEVDSKDKTVLGTLQKEWFKQSILTAIDESSPISCIIWANTMPWIDSERKWGHFETEQQELVDFLAEHDVMRKMKLYIISGDAHMLAVDDGSNSPGKIPTFHAAALGRPGSIKGGPYSHGAHAGTGQFGLMHVTEDPDSGETCVKFSGHRVEGKGEDMKDTVLLTYDTCDPSVGTPYVPPPVYIRQLLRFVKKELGIVPNNTNYAILFLGALLILFILKSPEKVKDKEE